MRVPCRGTAAPAPGLSSSCFPAHEHKPGWAAKADLESPGTLKWGAGTPKSRLMPLPQNTCPGATLSGVRKASLMG